MNKKILNIAVPNILSNLSIPLLSSVDTAVVGHLDKVSYLGAIAIGAMIFNAIYWGFGFLRMGTTGLTAQASGRKDNEEISAGLARALTVSLIGGLLLILFQDGIAFTAFYLTDASAEVEKYARSYFYIRIFAAPATLSLYALQGWFIGMQNAKYPMFISIFVNVLNLGFNLLFIYQFDMNSDGVALGTLCAQYIGVVFAVFLFYRKYKEFTNYFKIEVYKNKERFKKFFKLNFDIFIRTMSLIAVLSFFTAKSAEFGDTVIAANTILLQLWMIIAYGVDGFAYAGESLGGHYFGEKNLEKLKLVVRYCFYWGFAIAGLFTIAYYFAESQILYLYTDKEKVIKIARDFYFWIIIAPVINTICFIWDGIFIGTTASNAMRNTMVISSFIVFFPVFFMFNGILGNHALWFALTIWMISRGLSLQLLVKKHIYNLTTI